MRGGRRAAGLVLLGLLPGCDQAPVTWDRVLSLRIAQERPDCVLDDSSPGRLVARCGGAAPHTIEVREIAQFCQRGPRDCEYAVDQALLGLPPPAR